jgi:hemolysin activation/secretion protein
VDGALTVAGGSSLGELPMQRRWFLGGTETIRGQRADLAQSGDAFWMTRLEVARPLTGMRVSLFGDLGWTGDRTTLAEVGRPLSGVGIGLSALDGLIRLDLARGIYPREQTRVNLYLDARF